MNQNSWTSCANHKFNSALVTEMRHRRVSKMEFALKRQFMQRYTHLPSIPTPAIPAKSHAYGMPLRGIPRAKLGSVSVFLNFNFRYIHISDRFYIILPTKHQFRITKNLFISDDCAQHPKPLLTTAIECPQATFTKTLSIILCIAVA